LHLFSYPFTFLLITIFKIRGPLIFLQPPGAILKGNAVELFGNSMISIRAERPEDIGEIRKVIEEAFTQAFGQAPETDLVDRLHENCPGLLSLVAANGDIVVGHILFSPVKIEGNKIVEGMGLAPMAVLPKFQRQGIGTRLVQTGIENLKSNGCPFVIVLGHPDYYPQFGFKPASLKGILCQWDGVPNEAFMIMILDEKAMQGISGVARYRSEFDEAM
jgi:putative acetyltransferase